MKAGREEYLQRTISRIIMAFIGTVYFDDRYNDHSRPILPAIINNIVMENRIMRTGLKHLSIKNSIESYAV